MAGAGAFSSGAPDRWLVVEVGRPADPGAAGLVVDALARLSGRGVEERDGVLLAYFDRLEEALPEFTAVVRERLAGAAGGASLDVDVRWQPHEDWAEFWRRGLGARRVAGGLVVSPTWTEPVLRPGDRLLTLDPGIAFGSAGHPTTRGCLRLLVERVGPGQRVADVGTGSGILAIAAALFGARRVVALDSDPWACAAAMDNARRNGVSGAVSVVQATVGTEFLPGEAPFDGIVANLEAGPLVRRLDGFRRGTRPGAWAILGGILDEESARVEVAAARAGFSLEATDSEGGWWSGAFLG